MADRQTEAVLMQKKEAGISGRAGKTLAHLLLLTALVFGVYANSLHDSFVWDDIPLIKANADIKSFGNIAKILFSEDKIPGETSNYYRPLTYLSFMADYALWNGKPKGFHAVNILLHLLFACLLYLFVRDILGESGAALISASLFALHPAATETVNFIAGGRNTLLCGVFLMAALLSHRKDRLVPALLFFGLSSFSKEFGLLFPVIAVITDRCFPRAMRGRTDNIRTFTLYAAVIVFYLLLRAYVMEGSGFDLKPQTLKGRILLIPQVMLTYLGLIVLPYDPTVPYHFKMPEGIDTQIAVYIAVLFCISLLIYRFRRYRTVLFSSLWFLIFILPVLNIMPIGFPAAERHMYIALAGVAILPGAAYGRFGRPVVVSAVVIAGLLYSVVVIGRNPVWKDEYTLYSDMVRKAPDAVMPHYNLGNIYKAQGRLDDAVSEYQIAIRLNPYYADAHNNLGIAYADKGMLDDAIRECRTALMIDSNHADARRNLYFFLKY